MIPAIITKLTSRNAYFLLITISVYPAGLNMNNCL